MWPGAEKSGANIYTRCIDTVFDYKQVFKDYWFLAKRSLRANKMHGRPAQRNDQAAIWAITSVTDYEYCSGYPVTCCYDGIVCTWYGVWFFTTP
jgi:hypothetical protein